MRIVDLHKHRDGGYLYVGRLVPFHRNLGRIEPSPLGNPFSVKQYGRDCLRLYRQWLWDRIRAKDPDIMALMKIISEDTILGCWCTSKVGEEIFADPEVCHAQIVWKSWRWLSAITLEGSPK